MRDTWTGCSREEVVNGWMERKVYIFISITMDNCSAFFISICYFRNFNMSFRGRGGGGFRGGRGGGGRGSFRGRGGGRGGFDQGPPERVVPMGNFSHTCQEDLVVKSSIDDVPYFNAPIYLENKQQVGVFQLRNLLQKSFF